jgi:hypothetical protein
LPPDEYGQAGNGEADDQAEGNQEGGFHVIRLTRFALGGTGGIIRTNREHIDRPESSP